MLPASWLARQPQHNSHKVACVRCDLWVSFQKKLIQPHESPACCCHPYYHFWGTSIILPCLQPQPTNSGHNISLINWGFFTGNLMQVKHELLNVMDNWMTTDHVSSPGGLFLCLFSITERDQHPGVVFHVTIVLNHNGDETCFFSTSFIRLLKGNTIKVVIIK